MTDQDKDALEAGEPTDAFEAGEPNEFMPGEDEFEEELGEEDALGAPMSRAEAREEAERTGRRFRFGRGGDEEDEHPQGSLRTSHERVRIDDRLSAVFALICAAGLIAILAGGYLGQYMPKGAAHTPAPLDLQTFQPTASPSGSAAASASASASPTLAPTESPSASASAS
jgi:hypothetical protein